MNRIPDRLRRRTTCLRFRLFSWDQWLTVPRLTLLAAAGVFLVQPPMTALAEPSFQEWLKWREQEVSLREADANALRFNLLDKLAEMDKRRKEDAKNEREKLERMVEELEVRIEGKKWALRQFEPAERGLVPLSQNAPKIQKRWERIRKMTRDKFVNFPQQSRQQIKTGEALNFFLDACGPTVLAHQLQREQFQMESESKATQAAIARRDEVLGKDPQARDVRVALLDELHGTWSLEVSQLRQLVLVKGLVGNKLPVRLGTMSNESTLPLDWPLMLLHADYAPHRKLVEEGKQRAIEELAIPSSGGISARSRKDLMTGLDRLYGTFQEHYQDHLRRARKGLTSPSKGPTWIATRNYLANLRRGATRFLEARSPQDVEAGVFPPPGRPRVSVDELLAYMCRNGLRFDRAQTTTAEVAQQFVYQLLVQFYLDLYGLRLAMEEDQNKQEYSRAKIEQLTKVQYEAFTDPTAKARMDWRIGYAPGIGIYGEVGGTVK